jgi:hypothetical protein
MDVISLSHPIGSVRCYSMSIRLLAALALRTIVYRWAIVDGSSHGHRDDVHVGLLERLYRLMQLMAAT